MLSRVAIVVWWLGLLIALVGTSTYAWHAYERRDCAATVHLLSEVDNANAALFKRYMRDHPKKNDIQAAQAGALPQAANDTRSGLYTLIESDGNIPQDSRDTPGLRARAESCEPPNDWTGLAVGWTLALVLWSLSYILSGSFWLPGKSRS